MMLIRLGTVTRARAPRVHRCGAHGCADHVRAIARNDEARGLADNTPERKRAAPRREPPFVQRDSKTLAVRALLVTAADSGTQDVAERGARVHAAVFLHRLLVLIHLLAPDGEGELAGSPIDRDDLRIDLLADGEAIGALVALVARQL